MFQFRRQWSQTSDKELSQPLDWFPSSQVSTFVKNGKLGEKTGFQASSVLRRRLPHFGDLEDPLLVPRRLFPLRRRRLYTHYDTTGTKDVFTLRQIENGCAYIRLAEEEGKSHAPRYRADQPEPDGDNAPMWWRPEDEEGKFYAIPKMSMSIDYEFHEWWDSAGNDDAEDDG